MQSRFQQFTARHPYLLALLLLVIALGINYWLNPRLIQPRVLNSNLRIFIPLLLLVVGQAIVIIGGGVDLSVGAIVSLVNAVLVTSITAETPTAQIWLYTLMALGAGALAGAFNGVCVALLRLQPIVTTYATSFIFGGIALWLLPRPGGNAPESWMDFYRTNPLGIPLAVWAFGVLILLWIGLRATRFGNYLFAVGGKAEAAYTTGVPVDGVRLLTYVLAGFMAAWAALALTLSTGTGDPRIGNAMTLQSIVAVVLGGTRLSGGQGGIAGSLMGVVILGTIRNIISFANVPSWYQTLVDALIIVLALAGPGLARLLRFRRS